MKRIKFSLFFIIFTFLVNIAGAQNYSVESNDQQPLYFDFIYEAKPKIKKPVKHKIIPAPKRSNYIKDEVVLLYPTDKVDNISEITKQYKLKQKEKVQLTSVKTGMIVAKTNGQDPIQLSKNINKKEKNISAGTNNIFKVASTSFKNAYSIYETGVKYVHKTTQGKGTTICMVDTPVDIYHPSLSTALIETLDLIGFDPANHNSMLHGTSVAGILVSQNEHIGIAPRAKLYSVGAFKTSPNSSALHGSSSNVAKAIDACINHKVDVINLSFTGSRDTLLEKMVKKAIAKGIIVVAAAGNGGNWGSTIYPALIPGVITATAVDENQQLFSMADKGRFIDFSAPGVNILTIAPNGKYKLASGTSLSSAHVSGIAALLLSQERNEKVIKALTETAIDLGRPGRDQQFGEGLISASRALAIMKKN